MIKAHVTTQLDQMKWLFDLGPRSRASLPLLTFWEWVVLISSISFICLFGWLWLDTEHSVKFIISKWSLNLWWTLQLAPSLWLQSAQSAHSFPFRIREYCTHGYLIGNTSWPTIAAIPSILVKYLGGMWHLWKILLHFLAYIAGSHKEGLLHKAAAQFQSTKTWRLLQALALCIWSGVDICCIQNAQRLHCIPSLKLTQHLKIGLPNRKAVFQPSIFRGYVSLRE